ncbi:pentapeptide repeat-containing protein [Geodermatophilus sp. URMC 64]
MAIDDNAASNLELELIRTTIAVLAFWGAVLTGVYAYRKQRLSEGEARRLDERQFLDRYSAAAEQLGAESAATRIAGAYAMSGLADDWHEYRQMCVDVLCGYVRLPHAVDPSDPKYREGDREVRRAIVRIIRNNLRGSDRRKRWTNLVFSFEGAIFDYGDLSHARFEGGWVSFHRARFVDRSFDLTGTVFQGTGVSFGKATFEGGEVKFHRTDFSKAREVSFEGAAFISGEVRFAGTRLGPANFQDATVDSAANITFDNVKHGSNAILGVFAGSSGLQAE